MNFKQACEKLAKLEPGKFEWVAYTKLEQFGFGGSECIEFYEGEVSSNVCQDAIDSILAEVGWFWWPTAERGGYTQQGDGERYDIRVFYDIDAPPVFFATAQQLSGGTAETRIDIPPHPTKLEAAQAALIAVVEEMEREGK